MISGIFLIMLKALIVYYFIKMILEILLLGIYVLLFVIKLLIQGDKKNV
jgi:hypothetical protein